MENQNPDEELNQRKEDLANGLMSIYRSKTFNIIVDICRILMLIGVAFLIYYMIKEVEAVKLLASDPCQICMNKTGATCFLPFEFP